MKLSEILRHALSTPTGDWYRYRLPGGLALAYRSGPRARLTLSRIGNRPPSETECITVERELRLAAIAIGRPVLTYTSISRQPARVNHAGQEHTCLRFSIIYSPQQLEAPL